MTDDEPLPKKVRLSDSDLKNMTREELCERWKQEEAYIQMLEKKYSDISSTASDVGDLRGSEEKLKLQQQEAARRENILVVRLATKEQEMQESATQIQYLKQAQRPHVAQLRSAMVDPAVNMFFLRMRSELDETKDKLEQAQNELSAWQFTPDSQTGKKLMAKCRMLIQENQELGRQGSQGRVAQLEAELALQKKYSGELKSSQEELNDFIIQLDEEVEGMQSTILVLQHQLREARQQLSQAQCTSASTPQGARSTEPPPRHKDPAEGDATNGPGSKTKTKNHTGPVHRTPAPTGPSRETRSRHTERRHASPPPRTKLSASCSHSGGGTPLSDAYEAVDSPAGSDASPTRHSTGTDSNRDPRGDGAPAGGRGASRTADSRCAQNGLNVTI